MSQLVDLVMESNRSWPNDHWIRLNRKAHICVQIIQRFGKSHSALWFLIKSYWASAGFQAFAGICGPVLDIRITPGDLLRWCNWVCKVLFFAKKNSLLILNYLWNSWYFKRLLRNFQFCSLESLDKAAEISDQYFYIAVTKSTSMLRLTFSRRLLLFPS